MAVFLSLWLFGKPGHELNEGGDVTPEELRALAEHMHGRLTEAAEIVEKLTNAGWDVQMGLYDIFISHPYITTQVQAEEKLADLGIDPEKLFIDEFEDEEEFEEGEFESDDEFGEGEEYGASEESSEGVSDEDDEPGPA
jgi:hypothetical protein